DLSLKVQREAGLKVIGCREAQVYHEELIDERKSEDLGTWEADNAKLMAKWKLPAKDSYPDPVPAYQWMMREPMSAKHVYSLKQVRCPSKMEKRHLLLYAVRVFADQE
ncbi:MAG: hypothetical protein V1784_12225, partial [bacterium]